VVNNVCPHPHLPVAVTSGIDDVVRVWEPGEGADLAPVPLRVAEDEDEHAEAMLAELERGGHFAEVWDRLARRRGGDTDDDDADDERYAAEFDRWTRRGRVEEEEEEEEDDEDDANDDESSSSSSSSEASDEVLPSDDASRSGESEPESNDSDDPSGAGRAFANATTRAIRELVHAEARAEVARRRRREPSPRRVLDDAREDTSLPDSAAETLETRERGESGGGVDGVDASGRAEQAAAGPSGASGLRRSKRVRANANGGR
jgi:hypothetical protein